MADVYDGPFAGVSDVTGVIIPVSQTAIAANIALVKALIPDNAVDPTGSEAQPDFDQIPPHTAEKLRTEIDALAAAIAAAPTA